MIRYLQEMPSQSEIRRLALSFPQAIEATHHGMASFRVAGKIFATVPDDDHIRVMADEDEIRAVTTEDPSSYSELYWGGRLACVVVDIRAAGMDRIFELLRCAWQDKAPRGIASQYLNNTDQSRELGH
jgi:hypothetical protein